MSDLDKLMKKLKKDESPKEETPEEKPKVEDLKDPNEEFDDEVDPRDAVETAKDELVEEKPTEEEKVEENKPNKENLGNEQSIEQEVAVLQNNGVFRRELLLTLKELVDVHKANTQTLIDLKKLVELVGGENAKRK